MKPSTTRALNAADKQQKRDDILNAAEQLWLKNPNAIANMASVAKAAKVAKGTLYLYFQSKETLFLALHERNVAQFFDRVIEHATHHQHMDIGDMFMQTRQFMETTPSFLPLASLVHGYMERQIPLETSFEFEERTHQHLNRVVQALTPHFPMVTPALMLQSYALILGLWQLLRPTPLKTLMQERELFCACTDDYLNALNTALTTLWRGALLNTDADQQRDVDR